jgi:hypothetical protein
MLFVKVREKMGIASPEYLSDTESPPSVAATPPRTPSHVSGTSAAVLAGGTKSVDRVAKRRLEALARQRPDSASPPKRVRHSERFIAMMKKIDAKPSNFNVRCEIWRNTRAKLNFDAPGCAEGIGDVPDIPVVARSHEGPSTSRSPITVAAPFVPAYFDEVCLTFVSFITFIFCGLKKI